MVEQKNPIIAGVNSLLKSIKAFFSNRLVRNICFWLFLLYQRLVNPVDTDILPLGVYYGLLVLNIATFVLVTCINNFVLIPVFLARKKYVVYILLAVALSYIAAFTNTAILKYEHIRYPQLEIFSVSIVSSPLTNALSFGAIYKEMSTMRSLMQAFIIGFTGVWYLNAYNKKVKMMDEIVRKQVQTELTFLKNQINPHFLFNTLNNLYGLTLMKSDVAPEAILKLSSILRYMLYESNVPLIAFDKEKDVMQAYIDIEMLRLYESDKMTFTISSDRETEIPPLLWLPVLENVFKHGTTMINHEPDLDFRFTIRDNTLHIFSKNSYKTDRQDHHLEKFGGIGLQNLSKRLELLYPSRHSIETTADNGYYTVNIHIQLT